MITGIFGGTFDPVHNGHIRLAETAYGELGLDRVIFIPAYIPPHKSDRSITSEVHRLGMLKTALEDIPYMDVSDIEICRKGRSYTADTLAILKKTYENIIFIMGADSFMALEEWYRPEQIFRLAKIACAYRDGTGRKLLLEKASYYEKKYDAECYVLHMPDTDISSSSIREIIKSHKDFSGLVPKKTADYIKENGLYGFL